MATFTLAFVREKATKNTIRFTEKPQDGQRPVVGVLYVQRWAADQANEVSVVLTTERVTSLETKGKK